MKSRARPSRRCSVRPPRQLQVPSESSHIAAEHEHTIVLAPRDQINGELFAHVRDQSRATRTASMVVRPNACLCCPPIVLSCFVRSHIERCLPPPVAEPFFALLARRSCRGERHMPRVARIIASWAWLVCVQRFVWSKQSCCGTHSVSSRAHSKGAYTANSDHCVYVYASLA